MKPAKDPAVDYKALVRQGYDRCSAAYSAARENQAPAELKLLCDRLPSGAAVLDIGCGTGVPICRELARTYRVTGVDISPVQIEAAHRNVPAAAFRCGDIMGLDFPPESFDAVTSFYAIFHLPKGEHEELFRRIHRWLRPGGYLLATLANFDEEPYTEDDFFGVTMYWSNFGPAQYKALLSKLGFAILAEGVIGAGYPNATAEQAAEAHPFLFAQR